MTRGAALALALGLLAGCRGGGPASDPAADHDRRVLERLHERLEELVAEEPVVAQAEALGGEVALAVRAELVQRLLEAAAGRYLDDVRIDVDPDLRIRETSEVKVKVVFGRITAGEWSLDLHIQRVRARLEARAPELTLDADGRVGLKLPVTVREASGRGKLRFAWDARSLANALCRDFEAELDVEAEAIPAVHPFAASFRLSSGPGTLVATPELPRRRPRFRIRLEPTRETWSRVRKVLEEQDKLLRCGIALEPEQLIEKLQALTRGGFDVALPREVFREVSLPARVEEAVEIGRRRVELSVRPTSLVGAEGVFWYGASVTTRVSEAASD